jgi:hypothetical protein
MRAYITKYALSQGIFSVEGRLHSGEYDMFIYRTANSHFDQYAHGKDFHLTRKAAIERAEEMRKRKLDSLIKQQAKISNMTFADIKEL